MDPGERSALEITGGVVAAQSKMLELMAQNYDGLG